MGAKRTRHTEEFKGEGGVGSNSRGSHVERIELDASGTPDSDRAVEAPVGGGAAELFRRGKGGVGRSEEELTAPLYEEIGRLKVEVDWLKKKL